LRLDKTIPILRWFFQKGKKWLSTYGFLETTKLAAKLIWWWQSTKRFKGC